MINVSRKDAVLALRLLLQYHRRAFQIGNSIKEFHTMSETIGINKHLDELQEQWEESLLAPSLDKMPESQSEFTTVSLKPINRLYTPRDLEKTDFERDINFPGLPPYTRGLHPTGYRAKPWTMRQFAGFGSAFDTNNRFKYLLEHGQTG